VTRKAAELNGCSPADAARLADAASAVGHALGDDVDLAYRPTPAALVVEVRSARRGAGGRSLHAVLSDGDAFSKVRALVPAAELQGTGADECCFLTCPRSTP
jgi:hypothetical protein